MAEEKTIRVAILAPTLAERVGLRTLLGADSSIQIVAEAADLSDLEATNWELDLIIILGQDSIERLASFLNSEMQFGILWITDDHQAAQAIRELPLSAWGLLSCEASSQELITATQAIHQGLLIAPPMMLDSLWVEKQPREAEELIEQLTPRESEILELLSQGLANKQIALELEISEHTVKFHVSSIYTKLGVTNRMEAVRMGLQFGLITL